MNKVIVNPAGKTDLHSVLEFDADSGQIIWADVEKTSEQARQMLKSLASKTLFEEGNHDFDYNGESFHARVQRFGADGRLIA